MWKNIRRDVAGSLSRFVAIVIITALGAFIFAGLRATAPDMLATAEKYYADHHLMDYRILSSVGFDDDDVAALKGLSGVTAVQPAQRVDALVEAAEDGGAFRIHSAGDRMNSLVVIEGRLPEKADECAVGRAAFRGETGVKIGETITVTDENKSATLDMFAVKTFTVVGIVESPLYINNFLGSTAIGSGQLSNFAYVTMDAFDLDVYTELFIGADDTLSIEKLEDFGRDRAQAWYDDMYAKVAGTPYESQLTKPKWYVFDRDSNSGYAGFISDAERIDAISATIPVFFFLVAALVCLTTMTRMVDEQRTLIGSLKALGFRRGQIMFKYIAYAAAASVIGAVVGITAGLLAFPTVIWDAYKILYRMGGVELGANPWIIVATALVAVLSTTIPTWAACIGSLRETPASLMRPKAPKPGSRVLLERVAFVWKRLKFSRKVTVRNLFRSKQRLIMTVFGVFGCTALLLTGFGLRDSITGIAARQYDTISVQDANMVLRDPSDSKEDSTLNAALKTAGVGIIYLCEQEISVSSERVASTTLEINLIVPETLDNFNDFTLLDGGAMIPQDGSVILTRKLAEWLKVETGDTVTVRTANTDGDEHAVTLPVSGIAEYYVGHRVYMTAATCKDLLGMTPEYDVALLKFPENPDREAILAKALEDEGVLSAIDISVYRASVADMLKSMDTIVYMIIFLSTLLAFVVLYNLTNINITERARELATLKVVGFYDTEVRGYIYRENRVLTALGIVTGLVGGIFLLRYVIATAEVDNVMFMRTINWPSYLWAILITAAAAELVNLVMIRALGRIDMVDSLKSAE
ncbi:hypothetical protein FACS1894217_11500 [Clostridia bacterium]|nr:hypothetical protein FACS1894217_11500 [Clostridia bacterium]